MTSEAQTNRQNTEPNIAANLITSSPPTSSGNPVVTLKVCAEEKCGHIKHGKAIRLLMCRSVPNKPFILQHERTVGRKKMDITVVWVLNNHLSQNRKVDRRCGI